MLVVLVAHACPAWLEVFPLSRIVLAFSRSTHDTQTGMVHMILWTLEEAPIIDEYFKVTWNRSKCTNSNPFDYSLSTSEACDALDGLSKSILKVCQMIERRLSIESRDIRSALHNGKSARLLIIYERSKHSSSRVTTHFGTIHLVTIVGFLNCFQSEVFTAL